MNLTICLSFFLHLRSYANTFTYPSPLKKLIQWTILAVRACWSGSQWFGEQLRITDRSLPLIPHSIRLLWAPNGNACRISEVCQRKGKRDIRLRQIEASGDRWMWKRVSGVTVRGPIDLAVISLPLSYSLFSSLLTQLLSTFTSPLACCVLVYKYCWAPLYWIYELMGMSRHNRLGNEKEKKWWGEFCLLSVFTSLFLSISRMEVLLRKCGDKFGAVVQVKIW